MSGDGGRFGEVGAEQRCEWGRATEDGGRRTGDGGLSGDGKRFKEEEEGEKPAKTLITLTTPSLPS